MLVWASVAIVAIVLSVIGLVTATSDKILRQDLGTVFLVAGNAGFTILANLTIGFTTQVTIGLLTIGLMTLPFTIQTFASYALTAISYLKKEVTNDRRFRLGYPYPQMS